MAREKTGTSGGRMRTSGGAPSARALRRASAALFVVALATFTLVNALTAVADNPHEPPHHAWSWEVSSAIGWALLAFPIWHAVRLLRPPRVSWPVALGGHLAMTVAVSAVHVAVMVCLRKLAYLGWGESYVFADDLGAKLLYEYRKDFASYLQIGVIFALLQWAIDRAEASPAAASARSESGAVLEVPDGAVVHRVPLAQIDRAVSAGNYVEIGWGSRRLLHRTTLTALAEVLGEGFVRIHRGRLVRRDAVARIETDRSGDFVVTLASGEELRGSRRYRGGV